MEQIVLASRSPRRKQLLEWAEIDFDVIAKETDESYPADMNVDEVPAHIARNKVLAVRETEVYKRYDNGIPILAADTIVVLNNRIIGKPVDRNDAISILSALSGKTHIVITGVVLLVNEKEISFTEITEVSFHELSHEQICFYVDKYEPYDKAGAYAIQEWIGVVGIKEIKGDFYNVMGLPVSRVVKELEKLKI